MYNNLKKENSNERGISLIALIITIIVIIILAAIVIGTALTAPESANKAKFAADLSEVQHAVSTQLASNYNQYITNPDTVDLNAGFTRVSVIGAPESFNSFSLEGSESGTIGYLVRLDTIKMEQLTIGQDYQSVSSAIFDATDAFVYDNEGEVFYLNGYKYQDKIYYSIADLESGGVSTGSKETILFNLADNTEYGLSKTELDLSGEYTGVTVELIKDTTTLTTADGSLVLPYSFVGKEPGAYTVRAFGADYTANEITINIVDTIENEGTSIVEIYTKEQLANIGKGIVIYTDDIMYNGEVVASKGKWNYADTYTYKIMADIDLSSITNWEPIPEFKGSLQGNNFTISNLKIDRGSTSDIGLISKVTGTGEIKDIKLTNVNIKGANNTSALVGEFNSTGILKNCSVTGTVQGTIYYFTGGLVGTFSTGTMENCYSVSTVSGPDTVGGLIGRATSGIVKKCYSNSTVTGTYQVGGFIGRTDSTSTALTISECYSEGSATASINNAGGFIGFTYVNSTDLGNHLITNCYSKASAKALCCAGGFIGRMNYGSISSCYASGSAQAENGVGGFAGYIELVQTGSILNVEKCYSLGNCTSTKKDTWNNSTIGGFAGIILFNQSNVNYIKVNNNYSFGNVTSSDNGNCVGGFIGLIHVSTGKTGKLELKYNYSTSKPTTTGSKGGFICTIGTDGTKTITYTYDFWDTTTSACSVTAGSTSAGAIAGKITSDMKTTSTFSAWDSNIWNIVAGQYPTLKWDFTNVWNQVAGGNHTLRWQ